MKSAGRSRTGIQRREGKLAGFLLAGTGLVMVLLMPCTHAQNAAQRAAGGRIRPAASKRRSFLSRGRAELRSTPRAISTSPIPTITSFAK